MTGSGRKQSSGRLKRYARPTESTPDAPKWSDSEPQACRTDPRKVRRSREYGPPRHRLGAPAPDRSQEPLTKSPAWCGALGAFEAR